MQRYITKKLQQWRDDPRRLPLLLRGARQVGKTYIVEQFGKNHFVNYVSINFEYEPKFKKCFQEFDPTFIINEIRLLSGQKIIPGDTLLFLDEIQDCPRAIMALRYFKEKMPALHVIGAGSLLEFALAAEEFRMPVGRVQFMYLKPLSFDEYLSNHPRYAHLSEFCQSIHLHSSLSNAVHEQLLYLVKEYTVLGGMPAVLDEYFATQNLQKSQDLQGVLLNTYQNDFGKYATKANYKYCQQVFEKAPSLIGQHIKYTKISNEYRARDLKQALLDLEKAGLVYPVYATTGSGIPLSALTNEKKYKLLFLDVGLVKKGSELSAKILLSNDLSMVNQGALAEQFVGQELLVYQDCFTVARVYFWVREVCHSMAEVDFMTTVDGNIIPIEVKSGTIARMKSLHLLMQEKQLKLGACISQQPLLLQQRVLSIPFYLVSALTRLVREAIILD
jgi:uncharacterized protein